MRDTLIRRTVWLAAALTVVACGGDSADGGPGEEGESLRGEVVIDGSSTVFPVSEAVAEEFQRAHPRARVTVGQSGTGGGFKRFCVGETDISDASRPIAQDEIETCGQAGIEYIELPVAWDGLSVVTNPANDFLQCLTMDELRRIWEPNSEVTTWQDVRPEWPAVEIELFGPGTDSGTFDYFTETVMGESGASRADFQASEDDNILVQGVAGDESSLGYFGYAYVVENQDRLKLLGVDAGDGCVQPSDATIASGAYPLARPLFIYVKRSALQEPTVREYVTFMMNHATELVRPTGYHALPESRYEENLRMIAADGAGSDMDGSGMDDSGMDDSGESGPGGETP
ncbi:MAG: PstS family phosphate ABC transporter substrate-binding protein [Gemmatimonadota bacterium]